MEGGRTDGANGVKGTGATVSFKDWAPEPHGSLTDFFGRRNYQTPRGILFSEGTLVR